MDRWQTKTLDDVLSGPSRVVHLCVCLFLGTHLLLGVQREARQMLAILVYFKTPTHTRPQKPVSPVSGEQNPTAPRPSKPAAPVLRPLPLGLPAPRNGGAGLRVAAGGTRPGGPRGGKQKKRDDAGQKPPELGQIVPSSARDGKEKWKPEITHPRCRLRTRLLPKPLGQSSK